MIASNTDFVNALRSVLGLGPLPNTTDTARESYAATPAHLMWEMHQCAPKRAQVSDHAYVIGSSSRSRITREKRRNNP